MAGNRSATNYWQGLYACELTSPVMRGYLQLSAACCERFGTIDCLACPLVEFIPDAVPGCGAKHCERCEVQRGCPCGNTAFRDELLEEIAPEVTLVVA